MSCSIRCPATTVDEVVKRVNIPKGIFYLFYKSKELKIAVYLSFRGYFFQPVTSILSSQHGPSDKIFSPFTHFYQEKFFLLTQ
nr:TetR family transcriptional regulator [Parablautia intestinalis]